MDFKISASILNANFLNLQKDIDEVIDVIDEIHFDIMDGRFVENISYGPQVLSSLRKRYKETVFDTHLMIDNPGKYWKNFQKAGSDIIVFHYEATPHSYIILKKIKESGLKSGISVTPGTDISILKPLKNYLDRLLIMTVEPGFGGQKYIPEMLKKVEKARKIFGNKIDIEVDGGIKNSNIKDFKDAGANVFVIGSYIFKADNKKQNVMNLRKLI
ncbi:MAG: ribulose-phosphate 3-epimerase [Candidatus Mcinerneyibacterium aminivorans]|uniref:Ribulose-phosphate 3-epimerase n=1 Tax=Candidatus Mcinerneyibacterium aminivorans TaxID=2703815 RepID=A0A5D0MEK9_9BACT|nr:MAG: ribulose-phosphate 3-epimerase [Candidatus Mcinerneyibacterium aminivorans]